MGKVPAALGARNRRRHTSRHYFDGLPSWSAGPIPKARGPGSGPCCSPITIPMGDWFMPAAPAPASSRRNWNAFGAGCNPCRRQDAARGAAAAQ